MTQQNVRALSEIGSHLYASDWRLWLIGFWLFRPMGNKIKEPIRLEFNSYTNATQAKVSVYSHKASRGKRRRKIRIRNKETKKKMEKNTKDVEITRIVVRFVSIPFIYLMLFELQ